jgi:hypothetical protein
MLEPNTPGLSSDKASGRLASSRSSNRLRCASYLPQTVPPWSFSFLTADGSPGRRVDCPA